MSFYNPKIYNYKNLIKDDKCIVDAIAMCIQGLEDMKCDYAIRKDKKMILEQIESEIALETLDRAIERQCMDLIELMVSWIDAYEQDVEEIETDNYFEGSDTLTNLFYEFIENE